MRRADLNFNYYYPFYTIQYNGKKKYYYSEKIYIHLSRERRFLFQMNYDSGKLSDIHFKHENGEYFPIYDKSVKHISYMDFSIKIKIFEDFLIKGINTLKNSTPYRRLMIFGSNYKFNHTLEFEFSYGKITLKKGDFNHIIVNGKKEKKKVDYGDTELGKLSKALDVIDEYESFKIITESEFEEDLRRVTDRYIDYLAAPKFIRKKEYKI